MRQLPKLSLEKKVKIRRGNYIQQRDKEEGGTFRICKTKEKLKVYT
jgi:hypothetical protein